MMSLMRSFLLFNIRLSILSRRHPLYTYGTLWLIFISMVFIGFILNPKPNLRGTWILIQIGAIAASSSTFIMYALFSYLQSLITVIHSPPASGIVRLLQCVFPTKAFDRIFSQIVIDFRDEHAEMLALKRPYRARWLSVCLVGTLVLTTALWISTTMVKRAVSIWRIS